MTLIAVPAPAVASTGVSPLHPPLRIKIDLPASLPDLTVTLGHQAAPATHRVLAGRATRLIRTVPAPPQAAKVHGPVAVTAPGLISVVPVGPLPSALRPRVATETVRGTAQAGGTNPTSLPTPPVGFWFALVLLVLVFGSASYLIGDRLRYKVPVSITNR